MESNTNTFRKVMSPYLVLALLAVSLFLTISYFDQNTHVPSYIEQQGKRLAHIPVVFDEPINAGSGILVFYSSALLHITPFTAFKMWQIISFIGYLFVLYAITTSLRLTLLGLAYPPLIIDSYQAYTAIGIFLYALALLFILKKRLWAAFMVAFPLMLISQEAFVLFIGVLLYQFFAEKAYRSLTSFMKYTQRYIPLLLMLIGSIGLYLYTQYLFYGSPIANFIYNQTSSQVFHFAPSAYTVRVFIFACMFATSFVLLRYHKLLFLLNTLLSLTYLYFAIFGYDYLFIAVQRFYSGMIIYSIIAIGYITNTKMRFRIWG